MSHELPDVQAGFRKGRGIRDQTANIHWINEKTSKLKKIITSASLTTLKPLTMWITANWKILRDGNVRTLYLPSEKFYAGQKGTVRTRHGQMDSF